MRHPLIGLILLGATAAAGANVVPAEAGTQATHEAQVQSEQRRAVQQGQAWQKRAKQARAERQAPSQKAKAEQQQRFQQRLQHPTPPAKADPKGV